MQRYIYRNLITYIHIIYEGHIKQSISQDCVGMNSAANIQRNSSVCSVCSVGKRRIAFTTQGQKTAKQDLSNKLQNLTFSVSDPLLTLLCCTPWSDSSRTKWISKANGCQPLTANSQLSIKEDAMQCKGRFHTACQQCSIGRLPFKKNFENLFPEIFSNNNLMSFSTTTISQTTLAHSLPLKCNI